jgi:arylsulfatase A-like enzyme
MPRSRFRSALPALVIAASFASAAGCGREPTGSTTPPTPNVLLITIDTLRADHLGCYGSPDVKTPVMDGLAAEGAMFTRAISTSQGTNPSHASMLTGLYVARHRLVNNRTLLADEAVTLAEILSQRGYQTLAAVSVKHLDAANTHLDQGFDTFMGCEGPEMRSFERNDAGLGPALDELSSSGKPFFAWVHYYDPHGSYRPPEPFNTMYPEKRDYGPVPPAQFMEIDPWFMDKESVDPDTQISLYKGEVSYTDSELAALLHVLREAGTLDDTVLVIMGDHGESMTEHEVYFCHRGLYNPSLHVPLIVRFPRAVPAATRVQTLVSGVDVTPTVLDLLGIDPAPFDLDGASLVPTFAAPEVPVHDAVYSESVGGAGRTIYSGDLKFIKQYGTDPFISGNHLFHPWTDWGEHEDLLEAQPDDVQRLLGRIEAWYGSNKERQLPSRERRVLDPETEEALRALGYVDQVEPRD